MAGTMVSNFGLLDPDEEPQAAMGCYGPKGDDDDEAEEAPSAQQTEMQRRLAAAQWVRPERREGPNFLRGIPPAYQGEQASSLDQRGGKLETINRVYGPHADHRRANFTGVNVHYNDAEEQAAARLHFKKGKLRTADNENLDTTDASGAGTYYDLGAGKHIAVMTEAGHLRATDAWGHHEETRSGGKRDYQLTTVNHSSLSAEENDDGELEAQQVQWAGEIEAQDGQAISMSDVSGHYRTNSEMMYQAARKMKKHGAADGLTMKYLPKTARKDDKNPSPLTGKHFRDRWLRAGVDEVLSYGRDPLAETKMRAYRRDMRRGIGAAAAERDERREGGQMRMGGETVDDSPELRDPRLEPKDYKLTMREKLAARLFKGLYGDRNDACDDSAE